MKNLRALCQKWALKTYQQGLDDLNIIDTELLTLSKEIFKSLKIYTVPMDGYSCEKLPKTEESRISIGITYSQVFHEEIKNSDFSPAMYLVRLIKECLHSNIPKSKMIGTLARGLRTLTSLLREPDFAFQLKQQLISKDANVQTILNSKQDSSDHTDILLTYKNTTYRIWLYQFSSRGLPHDIERLTGKRGTLPDGIHLICPLHTELAIKYGKHQKKQLSLLNKLDKYKKNLNECSQRAIKKREKILQQINNTNLKIEENCDALNTECLLSSQELDIINGWFFYSKPHLKRIIQYIENTAPISYNRVVDTLLAPEKFIGTINMFKKGKE